MRIRKQQLELDMEQHNGSKSGEEYIKQNARLDESQAGNEIARRNVNNLRYADDTTLNDTKQRRNKKPLDENESGE